MKVLGSRYKPAWRGILLGILVLVVAGHLQAEDSTLTLKAAFLHYPPMAYLDENNEPAGSVVELTEQIAAQSGLRIEWVSYPIKRIYKGLETGDIDLWPGSQAIPALRESTLETPSIGIDITLCALSLEGTPAIERLQDLSHSQLVLIRGYTYRAQLDAVLAKNDRRPIVTPDHSAAIQLLERGRADYLISYNDPIEQALLESPQANAKCDVIDRWPLVYVVSRKVPDAQQLVERLTEAHRTVRAIEADRPAFAQAR